MRERLVDEASRLGSGENPCSANPGRGCGMKQARKVLEGVTRRERAKRCGRSSGESGKLAGRLHVLVSRRGERPWEVFNAGAPALVLGW